LNINIKTTLLAAAISTAIITSSAYAAGSVTSGLVLSGEGSYSMPTSTYGNDHFGAKLSSGFGLGAYIGYDYVAL
jgi:hypothetical protein